ncbi:kinase non-catalytic C-lobe domain-containing protein 1 isoform X1 [Scleropages formosus]|uniref:Kinase non-catalytic C-lobe domain containing 1 n=1 Tax=Scleropages formosus TaxID=113540 RepID=A0A8C9R710_SCLFO|nr:kinase non-catalytic C-lobe domain-containing protein 1 isoform X1 [Scleropages formosus]
MGTFETTAVTYYEEEEEEEEEEYYEFEPLPTLLEDEENVSLADILSLRDSCLSEHEVWAVCVECALSLRRIAHSPLFRTLCITPDTLAFNAHGNVCFMEHLSDDPEGSFTPPEFDRTGNTFEGHVFSLGATLAASLDFVIEPELRPELGTEVRTLLELMQRERPEERPSITSIVALAKVKLMNVSSSSVCRKLSAIGRRVLSIESVSTFQDALESSCGVHEQQAKARRQLHDRNPSDGSSSSEDLAADPSVPEGIAQPVAEERRFRLQLDSKSQNSSPVRRRLQEKGGRSGGVLNRSSSVPESNNPPSLQTHSVNLNAPVADLTEIGSEELPVDAIIRSARTRRSNRNPTAHRSNPERDDFSGGEECGGAPERSPVRKPNAKASLRARVRDADGTAYGEAPSEKDPRESACGDISLESAYGPSNHMTKSMLCLNEQVQDEWISLKEMLCQCDQPLTVNELWALCYTCLSTLQTYIDYPAYLCLDSVYVSCEGEMLFLKPQNTGSYDAFYLAPEFQEHGIVTEKVCVYGVAAILWATAKFNLSPNEKLAMPRKLKRLLLEMAKRTPIERPSIVAAKKSCREYLLRQRTTPEEVWAQLIHRPRQSHQRNMSSGSPEILDTIKRLNSKEPSSSRIGFVPMTGRHKLSPVQGPVPQQYPVAAAPQLPDAFTSSATHFTPIVLAQGEASDGGVPTQDLGCEGACERPADNQQPVKLEDAEDTPMRGVAKVPHEVGCFTTQEGVGSRGCSSASSSGKTLINSPPAASPGHTDCEGLSFPHCRATSSSSSSSAHSSSLIGRNTVSNYLLRQDPQTGLLTLFPVQIAVPEPIPGLNLNIAPVTAPWGPAEGQPAVLAPGAPGKVAEGSNALDPDVSLVPLTAAQMDGGQPGKHEEQGATGLGQESSWSSSQAFGEQPLSPQLHPSLQAVMALLRAEFAFNGSRENGVEDFRTGEYIFSLRDIQYGTFCSAICEKFCHLHWDQKLLEALYIVVNTKDTSLVSRNPSSSSSKAAERAAASPQAGEHTVGCRPLKPGCLEGPRRGSAVTPEPGILCPPARPEEPMQEVFIDVPPLTPPARGWKDGEVANGGVNFSASPVGSAEENLPNAEHLWHTGRSHRDQRSIDVSEEMEDSDSLASERVQEDGRSSSPGRGVRGSSCRPGWALAFYGGDCFGEEVLKYVEELGQRSEEPCVEAKQQELHQQLMIERRNLKKTRNFYQKLLHQEKRNKGSDAKILLSKLQVQLEEMKGKVEFLDSVKKYLEVLRLDQWGLDTSLLPSLAAAGPAPLELVSCEDSSTLSLQPASGCRRSGSLQAGTPLGLMSYLYSRNAFLEGFIQQFLYIYRYFCSPHEFLHFLMDKFSSSAGQESSGDQAKVCRRTLDVLQAWVEDCGQLDFPPKSTLKETLEKFLTSQVSPVDGRGDILLQMLENPPRKRLVHIIAGRSQSLGSIAEDGDTQLVHALCRTSSAEDSGKKSFQWRVSRALEAQVAPPKEKMYSIAAALPRPCYASLVASASSPCLKSEERLPFFRSELSAQHCAQHCAQQLTLLQQEMFQGCHPVHFLNSRAQGVRDKVASAAKALPPDAPPPAESGGSLFSQDLAARDRHLLRLLKYDDLVSNWVSAEIVICDSIKTQAALLSKFLAMAKYCYESRNFATAMQILGGLENVIVRQLPAWKHLSAKVCEVPEELKAVQVFLKSDNLCLTEGERFKRLPTLPATHILAMHVQQLEIGAFTLPSGACKWPKLRNIAKVVSQVHAFQENRFMYAPDQELQGYLRHRISRLSDCDIALLAAENDANFQQILNDRHSRKIQDTLRRMKATFQ